MKKEAKKENSKIKEDQKGKICEIIVNKKAETKKLKFELKILKWIDNWIKNQNSNKKEISEISRNYLIKIILEIKNKAIKVKEMVKIKTHSLW